MINLETSVVSTQICVIVLLQWKERSLNRVSSLMMTKHYETSKTKKENRMAQFMVTATYTDSAFAGMTTSPHNREEAIGKILSALNMNLESLHMTLGGKLFMVISGTAEAGGALMIVALAPLVRSLTLLSMKYFRPLIKWIGCNPLQLLWELTNPQTPSRAID